MTIYKLISIRNIFVNGESCDDTRLEYKIMRFVKSTEDAYQFYYKKVREIFEQYGRRNDNGEMIVDEYGNPKFERGDENIPKVEAALKELNGIEINDIPVMTFTLDELSKLKLGRNELFVLDDIIENKEGSE